MGPVTQHQGGSVFEILSALECHVTVQFSSVQVLVVSDIHNSYVWRLPEVPNLGLIKVEQCELIQNLEISFDLDASYLGNSLIITILSLDKPQETRSS